MTVFIAITGASGAIYAQRMLSALLQSDCQIGLCVSERAAIILERELGVPWDPARLDAARVFAGAEAVQCYAPGDLTAPFASGSVRWDGMVVVPCSMGTLGRIAGGSSDDLIVRAADVCLKERRPLVLVPRETPLNLVHIENMKRVCEAGGVVLPACPSFYGGPKSVEDLVDTVVARALDHLGVPHSLGRRWSE
ncbi:MAG: UbiX family flavin prenyltransferase [Armatimonadota bacterium]